jgi:serine/threonine-protein kinase HipA
VSYNPVEAVGVKIWGEFVGAVALDKQTGYYAFQYTPEWIVNGAQLAPLFMPNGPTKYIFPDLGEAKFKRLPAMIADALPDSFGNAVIDAYLTEEGISPRRITVLDRLAYVGERGMGALTFHPPMFEKEEKPTAVQLADLVTAAKLLVSGELGNEEANHDAIHQLIQVGTSAGGARPKAVIAYNPKTGQMRSGQVDAPTGFEQWLVKLDGVITTTPSGHIDLMAPAEFCRIEYAYYLMAKAAGIDISESILLPEGPRAHFMTKRFDRGAEDGRIHLQSLCAMSHLDYGMIGKHSYAQYFATISELRLGKAARQQAYRQMVFNVFAMNRDDHTKNFAFLLAENSPWRLAPAYDLIYSHDPDGEWTINHLMSVNGKFEGIMLEDLRIAGDKFLVEFHEDLLVQVRDAVADWPKFAKLAGISEATTNLILVDMMEHRPV